MRRRATTLAAELVFPVSLFAQGLPWMMNPRTFDLSENYNVMQVIAGGYEWGATWAIAAVILSVLVIRGKPAVRKIALFACATMFLFVGVSFIFSNPSTTIAYPVICLGGASLLVGAEIRDG